MQNFFISIHLLYFSTCFEHYCAHLQEDNCINTASGIVTLFRWLFSTQVTSPLVTCVLNRHPKSDDTRCCTNTIWPPEDEHNSARNMYRNIINVFFFHWHYSPLQALACRTMSFHFFLSAINSLYLLTPSTWRSLATSTFHPFLGLPLLLVPSSSWVKIFLGILSSSILSRWPHQLILCPFMNFTIFSPLFSSSSSRFVRLSHSPFSYLGPCILLNIFLSKISRAFYIINVLK